MLVHEQLMTVPGSYKGTSLGSQYRLIKCDLTLSCSNLLKAKQRCLNKINAGLPMTKFYMCLFWLHSATWASVNTSI